MAAPKPSPPKPTSAKTHRRSRSGCFTCRLRRKKCDEGKPRCKACRHLGLECEYKRPTWWSNNTQRQEKKDEIKNIIKNTKGTDKNNNTTQIVSMGTKTAATTPHLSNFMSSSSEPYPDPMGQTRSTSITSPPSLDFDLSGMPLADPYGSYTPSIQTPQFPPPSVYTTPYIPYEVDIKTERQTFVNDIPTRRDSSISTFSTFQPPPPSTAIPPFGDENWMPEDIYDTPLPLEAVAIPGDENFDFNYFPIPDVTPLSTEQTTIEIDDADRPLLDHFIDNVLRLIFPVLEVNQQGLAHSNIIIPALQTNRCYLHCCLSISAIHLKSISPAPSKRVDDDIMLHRFTAIRSIHDALSDESSSHFQTLEAILSLIYFQCSVGRPDDTLPDIPWHQHFQPATDLLQRLDLPSVFLTMPPAQSPPFNMTLAAWIDILGSTILGRRPQFAATYLLMHLNNLPAGFTNLMGCDDHIMFLISEIASLEAVKLEGTTHEVLCHHIVNLGTQLQTIQSSPSTQSGSPYSPNGALRPHQLSRNISCVFLIAARLHLCSLVPGFQKSQPEHLALVSRLTDALSFIPSGPDGFDRSLVWPLLIGGAFSTPGSQFRDAFAQRIERMGELGELGSFGRMVRVVREVWRLEEMPLTPTSAPGGLGANMNIGMNVSMNMVTPPAAAVPASASAPVSPDGTPKALVPGVGADARSPSAGSVVQQNVHWRDVMQQNGWDFLLI
ncbi:MAG: hypothetical protein M1834_003677 [Cirrosporium novae-zelandiae]|nr:MAG: hypothetical protein M1834_003677 [Cirrosporium novae-zelandiae]